MKIWTVRNNLGQYMGNYYARNALHAVQRFLSDQPQPARWANPKLYTAFHAGEG